PFYIRFSYTTLFRSPDVLSIAGIYRISTLNSPLVKPIWNNFTELIVTGCSVVAERCAEWPTPGPVPAEKYRSAATSESRPRARRSEEHTSELQSREK